MYLCNINVSTIKEFTFNPLAILYPYSTQAKNRPNRHELIFYLFGGIGEVSLKKFSNRDVLRVSPDSDTMSLRIFGGGGGGRLNSAGIAQEFITISIITLEHAARKFRNQLRIS